MNTNISGNGIKALSGSSLQLLRIILGSALMFACSMGHSVSSCSGAQRAVQEKLPNVDRKSDPAKGSQTDAAYDVTMEDAAQWCKQWQERIVAKNIAEAEPMVDWDGIVDRATQGLGLAEGERKRFRDGFKVGMKQQGGVEKLLVEIGKANQYRLVKIVRRDGKLHAVFRLLAAEGAMNYHDFRINRIDGKLIADRFFIAMTGEDLSDSFRNMILPLVRQQSILGKLTGQGKFDPSKLESLQQVAQVLTLARTGQHEEAIELYKELPEDARKSKMAMLGAIIAYTNSDQDELVRIVEQYSNQFPNDPSLGLVTIDAAVIKKDVAMLENAHRQLSAWTGGDAYLDLMVGANLARLGSKDRAVDMTKNIDPATLDMLNAHDYKLVVALFVDDFKTVREQLQILRDQYDLDLSFMDSDRDFDKFRASPEFKQLMSK